MHIHILYYFIMFIKKHINIYKVIIVDLKIRFIFLNISHVFWGYKCLQNVFYRFYTMFHTVTQTKIFLAEEEFHPENTIQYL